MKQRWKEKTWWGETVAGGCMLLLIALVSGKWLGFVGWSWWIVLAPGYIPVAGFAVYVIMLMIAYKKGH